MNPPDQKTPLDKLFTLRACRVRVADLTTEKDASYEAWQRENQGLLDALARGRAVVADLEMEIRSAGVAAYQTTGEKRPFPGVEVKLFDMLDYKEDDALLWAQTHQVALALDRRVFEAIAKGPAGGGMPFVTRREEPRATLARDLWAALGQEETP